MNEINKIVIVFSDFLCWNNCAIGYKVEFCFFYIIIFVFLAFGFNSFNMFWYLASCNNQPTCDRFLRTLWFCVFAITAKTT